MGDRLPVKQGHGTPSGPAWEVIPEVTSSGPGSSRARKDSASRAAEPMAVTVSSASFLGRKLPTPQGTPVCS